MPTKVTLQTFYYTAAVESIDYNPSSALAKTLFQGTGITLIQHPFHKFKEYSHELLETYYYIVILILYKIHKIEIYCQLRILSSLRSLQHLYGR